MAKLQKLELTWIGKENQPRLEPRILIEDPERSYPPTKIPTTPNPSLTKEGSLNKNISSSPPILGGDKGVVNNYSGNMLIYGDNLLALKALEQDFSGQIKCACVDPPYNTGNAFEQYDDGVEHSLWLSLIKPRIEIIHKLLREDGTLWISIDDNEGHYLKVLCDEIFGRQCFVATVIWRSTDNSNNDAKQFSVDHNMILVYSKSPEWRSKRLAAKESQTLHFKNPDNDPKGAWFDGNPISSPAYRANLCYELKSPQGHIIKPPKNGWRWGKETMKEKIDSGEVRFTEDGKGIRRRTYLADQKGLPPSTLWADLEITGHNRQAKYEQKKLFPGSEKEDWFPTPKPEKLIKYIFDIATDEGDIVLDSFLGSGTTAAVAQKMKRRWIGIELGEHAHTHCLPRLRKVVDGTDQGGISKAVNWQGGGGFKYYYLAPSLLKQDKYDNWIIDERYNANMLAAAMAKHEGFKYSPDEHIYWKQGKSTEKDYIFTTTNFITVEFLDKIYEEMQPDESLLICCKSFSKACGNRYPNITVKKIPNLLLGRCEFGREDYSLNIVNMPVEEDTSEPTTPDPSLTKGSPTTPNPSLTKEGSKGGASKTKKAPRLF